MEKSIFRKNSRTFYTSALFFPRRMRRDVFNLYSFLRVVDDLVDQTPPNRKEFARLKKLWAENNESKQVIQNILQLEREGKVERDWVEKFFESMELDIKNKQYKTMKHILEYTHGSAEVVGLMMARIMNLPQESYEFAELQGRAFQWVNFIRDIEEDNQLGRQYFPNEDLKLFNLKDLSKQTAIKQPKDFRKFIHFEIERYRKWQKGADKGYKYIPKRPRASIQTAADMYEWTAKQIEKDPSVVFDKKVKPSKNKLVYVVLTKLI